MAIGSGARLGAGAAVAVAVVAVGLVIWGPPGKAPEPAPDAATATATPAPAQPAPADTPAPIPPEAPRFDVVRVDGGGLATVAGTAPPEARVSLRIDGVEAQSLTADGTGQFATLLTLPPSDAPRMLSLVAILADGTEVPGTETVALAPVAAPVVAVAETAEPAPETAAPAEPAPQVQATPPAALLVAPEGVKVLQDAPGSEALAKVQIDSIAYAPDGAVLLGGRAEAGAALRLYLDDQPVAEVTTAPDGRWNSQLADVAPGLHRLRADQLGADGKVVARFETPFKREEPAALAALAEAAVASVADPVAPEAPAPQPAAEPAASTAPAADPAPQAAPAPVTITVQPGFTLWGIAESSFGDGVLYVQVFEANKDKIKDPDLIYPGQIFTVPQP